MNKQTLKVLKTLAHPTRLSIIKLISDNDGNLCYNNVVEQLKLSITTANFHIKKLESAKLIITKKQKSKYLLFINKEALQEAKKEFASL